LLNKAQNTVSIKRGMGNGNYRRNQKKGKSGQKAYFAA
jgi:hypothetical protein